MVHADDGMEKMNVDYNNVTQEGILSLTNKNKRQTVLDAWRDWPLWWNVPEIGLEVHKLELPDGSAFTATWYAGDDFFPGGGTRNVNTPRFAVLAADKLPRRVSARNYAHSVLTDHLAEMRKELMKHETDK